MRNFLSDEGLLSWEDEDFVIGVFGDDGRFIPGQAAKWKAGEELMAMMERVEGQYVEQDAVVVEQKKEEEKKSILYGCKDKLHEHDEVIEEEKTILYGCKSKLHEHDEVIEEEKTILYGYKPTVSPETPPNPGQSESYFDLLDSLNLWIPIPRPRFAGYSTGQFRKAA